MSVPMTLRVPTDVQDKLARLAHSTRRSRFYLAAEALTAYVERELSIVEGIERGLADVAAGRTVPHDVVMDRIDALIAKAKAAQG